MIVTEPTPPPCCGCVNRREQVPLFTPLPAVGFIPPDFHQGHFEAGFSVTLNAFRFIRSYSEVLHKFVFAPCAMGPVENPAFEIARTPIPLDDREAEDKTRL